MKAYILEEKGKAGFKDIPLPEKKLMMHWSEQLPLQPAQQIFIL